ncbi:MAG: hypothetical protein WB686_28405, partial [Pseudolabrys sp.]
HGDDHRLQRTRLLWAYLLGLPPFRGENGVVGWKLLQRMATLLRVTREEAHELEKALGILRH